MKSGLVIATAALTLVLASAPARLMAHASLPPPDASMLSTWPATLKQPPATQLLLGSLRIQFGKTTLDHVVKALGVGEIAHQGDAGNSTTWLCYTVPNGAEASRLWLVSGEIDGGKYVTGITAELVPDGQALVAACPALPEAYRHVAIDNAVWIGMPAVQLSNSLGKPSHVAKSRRMFDYSRTFKTSGCTEAQQDSSLWVRIKDGKVAEIQAYQTITC
jgi:hypothetical protein